MAIGFGVQCPKPERLERTRNRKRRVEGKVKKSIRALCVERDGPCRLLGIGPWDCEGPSQWAHLEDKRRAKTRGMEPELRHTTDGSAMLCQMHHEAYDKERVITLKFLTARGANGPIRWFFNGLPACYDEPTQGDE